MIIIIIIIWETILKFIWTGKKKKKLLSKFKENLRASPIIMAILIEKC
jgi:hypothetical protein